MTASALFVSPERTRVLRGLALGLVPAAGLVAAVVVLAFEPVSDFLGEGAVRVLTLDGGSRRAVIGVGLIVATLVVAGALVRGRGFARYVIAGSGVIGAVFLAGPLGLPLAAATVLVVIVERAGALTRARLEQAAPRRHPAVWAAGGALAVIAFAAAGWLGWWLTAPLFDEGRALDEALAFAVATPAADAGATAGAVAGAAAGTGDATGSAGVASGGGAAGSIVSAGELVGADSFHTGSGQVLIVRGPDGAAVLRFQDYAVRNGPDLRVYLTPDAGGDVFAEGAVDLGEIRATRGNVNYDVPAGVDLASFRAAVVYCYGFRVTFATALLE